METNITIKKVTSDKEINDFLSIPRKIYRDEGFYISEFRSSVKKIIEKKDDPDMPFVKLNALVAYRNTEPVGRILGIINENANSTWNTKVVRFGMIEFVDDPEVPATLLNAVAEWGKELGMNEIQDPLGITNFDKAGMLIEDFELPGNIISIYNPPYYPDYMERLGFEKRTDWVQAKLRIPTTLPPRFARAGKANGNNSKF